MSLEEQINSVEVEIEEKRNLIGIFVIKGITIEGSLPFEKRQLIAKDCYNRICSNEYNWSDRIHINEVEEDVRKTMGLSESVEITVFFAGENDYIKKRRNQNDNSKKQKKDLHETGSIGHRKK